MSLINDALKKAQRQRTNNPFGIDAPVPGGGGRVVRRGSGMPTQTIVLIAAGCALLIVISGVGAVLFVNRKPTPASKPAAAIAATSPAPAPVAAPPAISEFPALSIVPIAPPPARNETAPSSSVNAPPAAAAEKSPEPGTAVASTKSNPADSKVSLATPAPPPAAAVNEEKIHAYLDALHISGVRGTGSGSRVLLNEKVYRVNDMVDRSLGLKLTAVESDHLKFTASNGVEYEKSF